VLASLQPQFSHIRNLQKIHLAILLYRKFSFWPAIFARLENGVWPDFLASDFKFILAFEEIGPFDCAQDRL
jgi:hypothetical protein